MISGWTIIMQSAAICQRTCNVFPPVRSRPLASVSNEITFACIFLHGISHDNTSGNFALPSIYQIVGGPCYLLSATYRLTSRTACPFQIACFHNCHYSPIRQCCRRRSLELLTATKSYHTFGPLSIVSRIINSFNQ